MIARIVMSTVASLLFASLALSAEPPVTLVGTWQLVSRIDRNAAGTVVPDSSLGADPVGYLIYDDSGHVAVQMMKKDRQGMPCGTTAEADSNNLAHVGGYDAYFGRYEVDAPKHLVTHILEGAIGPADVGRHLTRNFNLQGDTLILSFEPGGTHNAGIVRTLTWHRVSHQ